MTQDADLQSPDLEGSLEGQEAKGGELSDNGNVDKGTCGKEQLQRQEQEDMALAMEASQEIDRKSTRNKNQVHKYVPGETTSPPRPTPSTTLKQKTPPPPTSKSSPKQKKSPKISTKPAPTSPEYSNNIPPTAIKPNARRRY